MKLISLLIGIVLWSSSFGQNLTGIWTGQLTQNTQEFNFEIALKKIDSINYNGISTISINGEQGIIRMECRLIDGVLSFTEKEILLDEGVTNKWCLKAGKLTHVGIILSGDWWGGCDPGTIELSKIENNCDSKEKLFDISQRSKLAFQKRQSDKLVSKLIKENGPGASVTVVKNGEIIYENYFGKANLEYNIPIDSSSIFNIASVSKQFTIFAVLLLEKRGKLSLDDDIRKYIPEVPDFGQKITLKHLASHTSGLRDDRGLMPITGWLAGGDIATLDDFLKLISSQKELNFKPGEQYSYCNTGYSLLAEVVARVSNKSFVDFTKENIFIPLQMLNSSFIDNRNQLIKNLASPYSFPSTRYQKWVINYEVVGATNLYTNVGDLSKWIINFSDTKVGGANVIQKMKSPIVLNDGTVIGKGLGQVISKHKGINEIHHGGSHCGYKSYLCRFPEENFSVIIISNSNEFNPGKLAYELAEIYLSDKIDNEDKTTVLEVKDSTTHSKVFTMNELVGTYQLNGDSSKPFYEVTLNNDTINMFLPIIHVSYKIVNVTGNNYRIPINPKAKITFSGTGNGLAKFVTIIENGKESKWERVEKTKLDEVKLKEFTGEFYCDELSTKYNLSIVNGKLVAKHFKVRDFALEPFSVDVFSTEMWFIARLEFIRDRDNIITGFKVSNARVKNLHFRKVH